MELLIIDYLVIATLLVSAVLSLIRGFTKEVFSIVNWVIAIYAALFFSPLVKPLISPYINIVAVVNIGAFLAVFLVVFVVASLITNAIAERFKKHTPGVLDHTLGVAFGLARGTLIVCLAYFALVLAIPERQHPDWVRNAKTRPLMQTGVAIIVRAVPLDRLPVNISHIEGIIDNVPTLPEVLQKNIPQNLQDKIDDKGYKDNERKLIERLIRNTEKEK